MPPHVMRRVITDEQINICNVDEDAAQNSAAPAASPTNRRAHYTLSDIRH